ncbi:MAG TPA: Gfo/Idh/MocA family oxidoreductase [Acidothermaceae bacterium]|jgi:predicted dehydrogenase
MANSEPMLRGDSVLRLGLIGCGRIAQVAHLPAISKEPTVQLVAVSDPSSVLAAQVGARYGVPGYTDTAELLREDLDAVLIAVPDRFHLSLGTQALEAGLHVLIEKPAALDSTQAIELTKLAAERGRKLQVGAMRRHDPALRDAQQAVASIGPILSASFWYRLPSVLRGSTEAALFPPVVVDEAVRSTEAEHKVDRETYLLRTHGAHVFDSVRYLLGEATAIRAELVRNGADLHWQGSIATASTAAAAFAITANVHSEYSEGVEIFGAQGHLRIRSYFPFYRRASSVRIFNERSLQWHGTDYGAIDPYQRQLAAFAAAIADDGDTDPSGADGVAALQLIEATARSVANDGMRVAL